MFNNWKQRLLSGWSFMRILRLGLAVIVLSEAFKNSEILFGILGGILMMQAVLNVGCCGADGCYSPYDRNKPASTKESIDETTFTEIK